jgi:hypothetical protein
MLNKVQLCYKDMRGVKQMEDKLGQVLGHDEARMFEEYVDQLIEKIMSEQSGPITESELMEKVDARVKTSWALRGTGKG